MPEVLVVFLISHIRLPLLPEIIMCINTDALCHMLANTAVESYLGYDSCQLRKMYANTNSRKSRTEKWELDH